MQFCEKNYYFFFYTALTNFYIYYHNIGQI